MEFQNGLLAGLTHREADEKYPYIPALPLHASVYGQESQLAFRFRAESVLSKILSENGPEDTVAIVSHGGIKKNPAAQDSPPAADRASGIFLSDAVRFIIFFYSIGNEVSYRMKNQLYRAFLRLPPDSGLFFSTGDTGIHEWVAEKNSRRVEHANRTAHTAGI